MAQQTGAIYHQGILYSGGSGTNVTPNPQGEATDTLNTVEIDGTVYGIEGGGGSDVTITPTLNTGQKLADYSIDGTSGAIYMPTVASGDLVINPSETPTEELTKIGVSSSVEDAYLTNGKIATSAGYYITCPLDKTLVNGTYTVRVRDGDSEYNFEVTYSGSTITKSWSAGSNNYTLTITSTTAGMSYYSGSYRNIYCDIVMMMPQMDVYSIGGGSGGSNLIIDAQRYSLEEQVIGIWTDGKPLYQKTIHLPTLPSTPNTYTTYPHGIQNIDTICGWDSVARWSTGTIRIIPSTQYVNNSQNIAGCFDVNITKTGIEIWVGQDRTALNSDFTIWYTKTTDTAGSGGYQAYGFSPIIYSDKEREVGVWRDNKPLYQKTWSGLNVTPSYNSWTNIIPNDVNIETIVGYQALASNSNLNLDGIGIEWQTLSDYIRAEYVQNTSIRAIGSLTLLYTKTTDVAGSGEYNTLAIPNVHYSTDEQVIGTWMGETLYQKTCATPLTLNTGSGEKTYTLDISNVDKVISVDYSVGTNALSVNVTRTDTPDEIRARINQGNQLLVWSGYDRSTLTIYTTIKYTKTTD